MIPWKYGKHRTDIADFIGIAGLESAGCPYTGICGELAELLRAVGYFGNR